MFVSLEVYMLKKTIIIDGMICNHCANEVKEILEKFATVKSVQSDIGKAVVDASEELPRDEIAEALSKGGYALIDIK